MFSVNNFDNHLSIYIFGIHIKKKLSPVQVDIELSEYGLNKEVRNPRIIASLTTFPDRINTVSKTISTLLKQTLKPDMLILWLAKEQFPNKEEELPDELLKLKDFGLAIKWCNDIRSYKKLIPALKEFSDDIVITFDDDVYYPFDTVEKLYNSYLEYPKCIHANRVRRFFIKNNEIMSKTAADMYWVKFNDCSFLNKITGCGGVLYPPHSLCDKVFSEEEFERIVPTQDDVWFWAMAVLNNTKIKLVGGYDIQLPTVEDTQNCGLSKINSKKGKGIDSLDAARIIAKEYPEILEKLKMEDKA